MNRVQKLEGLLARVRERREGPRLRTVSPALAPAQPSNQAQERAAPSPVTERFSRPAAAASLEDAMSELAPTPMARTPTPGPRTPVPSGELSFDDFEPARPAPARAPEKKPAPAPVAKVPPPPEDMFEDPFASRPPPAAPTPVAVPVPPAPVPVAVPAVAAPVPRPVAIATPAPQPVQLGAPSARIAAEAPSAHRPVVRAVSPVRTEAPNTFGELLERTLSLRPR